MRLGDLLPSAPAAAELMQDVSGVTADSRKAAPGSVFFAVPGVKADGLSFAEEAIARGAVAIVAERPFRSAKSGVASVVVPDARAALAQAAAVLYPRQPATIVAITGTSGKTSVAAFVRQIWASLGHAAASLGTIGIVAPSQTIYGSLTTPDPMTLHETLQKLNDDGVTRVAMEASSHGLEQRRLDGVRLSAGAFTNLSRDHLDYHASLEDYLASKLRLFEVLLEPGQSAVVDADDDVAQKVIAACTKRGLKVMSVGARGDALRLISQAQHGSGMQLVVEHAGTTRSVRLPLAGLFQTSNALVAAALCIATGDAPQRVFAALEKLEGAPGRLELIGTRAGAPIFVDYAHKPDALEKALAALRPLAQGRLIVVFGCGGNRDHGKRPLMGEIAARQADIVIVTDDNPRSENPADIRAAILEGARRVAANKVVEIGDRRAAIAAGIADLRSGDVLVVAGKGHETGQIVGDKVLPFSDHEAIRQALREHAA
ncbi:MAG: UDP-N-acetylmuramoyl-L-alanyl-D-glutamate--2,6-diaminopimelate ligase [Methylobacteriaceae bacterium]|jgi:UDP-N-acetylmuramoyl-L-alanyl-D-glutamate--2,6-diaminopimelate ligase|nr:UDP-N-acetylmuramoyl-L-alanyl-D-glutamate--2,6-diaminopimelate ligase [Methylobacteriaceae bacterium]